MMEALKDRTAGSSEDGYEFEFDPSTLPDDEDDHNIKEIFGDALAQWCSATNVRFKQKAEANTEPAEFIGPGDGKNLVIVSGLNPSTFAAVLFGQAYFQISCGVEEEHPDAGYVMTDIDLIVNTLHANILSAEEIEIAILHELGHAHLLNHARCTTPSNCSEPLMYPRNTGGADNITNVDETGANRTFSISDLIINNAGNCRTENFTLSSISPIMSGSCGVMTDIEELHSIEISAFPNPTSQTIQIQEAIDFKNYTLRDINGNVLIQGVNNSSILTLNLRDVPSGAYYLVLFGDNKVGQLKIIKL
ncbi:MAG: T9SS type A sorting domain-containing protein [Chitinophagales bacterium]|nr:T9SS type A sorting domain-containing protein [Chitinophagales bacterium]